MTPAYTGEAEQQDINSPNNTTSNTTNIFDNSTYSPSIPTSYSPIFSAACGGGGGPMRLNQYQQQNVPITSTASVTSTYIITPYAPPNTYINNSSTMNSSSSLSNKSAVSNSGKLNPPDWKPILGTGPGKPTYSYTVSFANWHSSFHQKSSFLTPSFLMSQLLKATNPVRY